MRYVHHTFDLCIELVRISLKRKTQGSLINLVWDILYPCSSLVIIAFFFRGSLGKDIAQYPLYVFIGLLHTIFIFTATRDAMKAMLENADILKSVKLSPITFIVASVLSAYLPILISWIFLFLFIVVQGDSTYYMFLFPLIFGIEFLLVTGISLFLATIAVYVRELTRIWGMITSAGWIILPVFYALDQQNDLVSKINYFNPLIQLISLSRSLFLYHNISIGNVLLLFVISLVICISSLSVISILKKNFIELL